MGRILSLLGGFKVYAIVGVLSLLAGAYGMHRWDAGQQSVKIVKQAVQTVRLVEHQAQITFNIEANYIAIRDDDAANTIKLLGEVPVHVTPQSDTACTIPMGFVRVFNAATHGPVPDAASGPDAAPSGIALSDVAKTDTINAGQYDIIAHQLTALQDWVAEQSKAK